MNAYNSKKLLEMDNSEININNCWVYSYVLFSKWNFSSKGKSGWNLNINEIIEQRESFFKDHPRSFMNDENKSTFLINRLQGPPNKWGFSLKFDDILKNMKYEEFKELLQKNFGNTKE